MKRLMYQPRRTSKRTRLSRALKASRKQDASLTTREHHDHDADKGFMSEFHVGLVHLSFPRSKAMKMQEGLGSWNKLNHVLALDVKQVKPKAEVAQEAGKKNTKYTFHLLRACVTWNTQRLPHTSRCAKNESCSSGPQ